MLLGYDAILRGGVVSEADAAKEKECADVFGMPHACNIAESSIGVEVGGRSGDVIARASSCFSGYEGEAVESDEDARTRPVCVSRRRLGPSFTLGCV